MEKNRIMVCGKTNQALKRMKGMTGLTPNILCRMGFCLSLQSPAVPDINEYRIPNDQDVREFNRYTLFGKDNFLYMALLKQWTENGKQGELELRSLNSMDDLTEAHLNRGSLLLLKKLNKGVLSFAALFNQISN
jgi:DNA sulfur modification protein DndE